MNQEQVIALAREAGFKMGTAWYGNTKVLERFAALITEATKKKAAKIADAELMNTNMLTSYPPKSSAAWNIAAAIRSMK